MLTALPVKTYQPNLIHNRWRLINLREIIKSNRLLKRLWRVKRSSPYFFFQTHKHTHTIHSHSWALLWRPHTTLNLGSIYTFSPHQNQKKRGAGAPTGGRRVRGRTLVEDGRRSVVDEGGAEVDLQGTVTAGRGGAGQRGAQWEFGGAQRKKVVNPKEMSLPPFMAEQSGGYLLWVSASVLWEKSAKGMQDQRMQG